MNNSEESGKLLRPGEAAQLLGVTTKTLVAMVDAGHVPAVILPSGHRRYRLSDVQALVSGRKIA